MSQIIVAPLLPPIAWLDILLPPLLISFSIFLHLLTHPTQSVGHIYEAKTAHARFLPKEGRHLFNYSVLFFGIWLKAGVKQSSLGRWFGFNERSKFKLTGFQDEDYFDGIGTIREKLGRIVGGLEGREVYFVSMPAYFGFRGINPLSIHFIYKRSIIATSEGLDQDQKVDEMGEMEMVVLEVHNTFGERHVYILKVGIDEDEIVQKGFTNQWTFPRSFHVSPFNDRSGFYTISLSSPFLDLTSPPILNLKIVFLTEMKEKKLYASLLGSSKPLNEPNLLSSLIKFPFSLFLTSIRILYQAGILHYTKKLLVFPRPEPFVESFKEVENPVGEGGSEGSVGWQEEGGFGKKVKEMVLQFVKERVKEEQVTVIFRAAGRKGEIRIGEGGRELVIDYLTDTFWIDFITFPSFAYTLGIGGKQQNRFKVNNEKLFLEFFTNSGVKEQESWRTSVLSFIRKSQLDWETSFTAREFRSISILFNPISPNPSLAFLFDLILHCFIVRLGYWVFLLVGAKFVPGMETWGEWKVYLEGSESLEGQLKGKEKIVVDGSALDF